jgi:RNA recognition motif-containing protein
MTTKLRIDNMPRNSTPQKIEGLFGPIGQVPSVALTRDLVTGENTGCGTLELDNESDAQSAINRPNIGQFVGWTMGVSRKRSL